MPFLPLRSLDPPTWSALTAGGFDPRVFFVTSLLIVLGFRFYVKNSFSGRRESNPRIRLGKRA